MSIATCMLPVLPPAFTSSRLVSLYADWRLLKVTNPEGYEANMDAWVGFLAGGYVDGRRVCVVDGRRAARDLACPGHGRPVLDEVVARLVESGQWVERGAFMGRATSVYRRGVWDRVAGWWRLSRMDTVYVAVAGMAKAVQEEVVPEATKHGFCSGLYVVFLVEQLREWTGQAEEMMVYLQRDANIGSVGRGVVKIHLGRTVGCDLEAVEAPTDTEVSIVELYALVRGLEASVARAASRVAVSVGKARGALGEGDRLQAMVWLRVRRRQAQELERAERVLHQALDVVAAVENSATAVEVAKVMQGATKVLRAANHEAGLLQEVMEEARDEVATAGKMETARNETTEKEAADEEDEELERELKQLERGEEEEVLQRLAQLKVEASEPASLSQPQPGVEPSKPAPRSLPLVSS